MVFICCCQFSITEKFRFFLLVLATNFSKIIAELEATQQTLLTSLAGNKTLLQNVQEAFAVNLENVKKEVGKLESRLDNLKLK